MNDIAPTRCPRSRTAIMTVSGRYWDVMDPRPEWVWMPDVARGLGCPRFNLQTIEPITVASHLIRCARMFVALEPRFAAWIRIHGLGFVDVVLALLLHDADEGYLGDRLGPLKTEADSRIEAATRAAIVRHLILDDARAERITGLALDKHGIVKWFDRLACAHEALAWQPGASDWAMPEHTEDSESIDPSSEPHGTLALALTMSCVHPRPGDDWLDLVASISRMVNNLSTLDMALAEPASTLYVESRIRTALR